MQQKTYDFLVKMKLPMFLAGSEFLGDGIEIVMNELEQHQFVTMTKINETLAEKFECSSCSVDRRMRRALDIAEFRSGTYPNQELEHLKEQFSIENMSVKKFLYAGARYLMNG